ncbi:MAG TPA: hypothetical protein PLK77_00870 [Pyrinomonadaceae bacterium]|nr:hypothetical protein [Pyrinomonadaceae bacterium]
MRNFLPLFLLILSVSAVGQDPKSSNEPAPMSGEFLAEKFWTSLGKPTEGTRGYALFTRNMQPKSDTNFEFWVRIVPTNATAFNRRYSLPRESAFVIQHATVDCSKRTVYLERTGSYDASNNSLDPKGSDLIKGETRSRVRAGSVSETLFDYICLKLE